MASAEPSATPAVDDSEDALAAEVVEVFVEGERTAAPEATLTHEETRRMPGALGDPFRAIEALPGVTPTISGLPFFFVRGAPPGNVGYFLDGVRVPYLFHAGGGPAVVHPDLIERVDLHSGTYPARFGRYAGGIVTGKLRPPTEDYRAEGTLRLTDVGALAEARFADGAASALVAGRYSYTGLIVSQLVPELTLDYRDFQARATLNVSDTGRISLFAFGSYDDFATSDRNVETGRFATEFYRVDARYDTVLDHGGQLRAAVTTGFDDSILADGRRARNILVASRVVGQQPLSETVTLQFGFDVQQDIYDVAAPLFDPDDLINAGFANLFRSRPDAAAGTWAGLLYRPTAGITIAPSLRVDAFLSDGEKAVSADPRLATSIRVTDRIRLKNAVGIAHQAPSYLAPVPGVSPANLEDGLQTSLQSSMTIELSLPAETIARLGVFNNTFLNMTDGLSSNSLPALPSTTERTLGSGRGVELYLFRSLSKRLGGFISCTLSRTERSSGSSNVLSAFDRTHVFSGALGYDFGNGYIAGVRVNLRSGAPQRSRGRAKLNDRGDPIRDPTFSRFDFRFEKRWHLSERSWLALVFEVVNAAVKREVVNASELPPVVLPNIGLEAKL